MSTMIFVNLPVRDLDRSKAFYEALGWSINPLFTDEKAACVVISDEIMLMILRRDYFQTFTSKEVADPATTAQALLAISRESREDVADVAAKALAAGGSEAREAQDYGFMVQHAIEDPDGNVLEFMWMDPKAAEQGPGAYAAEGGADS
ncbi:MULTISPECIES: VOC family protein [unclassified Agrococcus]|uniref:VOC family protein n=1 Tax=unclassified Agrococcus TaxID=2615065 RepID=UPI00361B75BA